MNSLSSLFRALRGPVMLTALGILFVLEMNTSYGFRHTWPILVILFGLMKLLEATASKASSNPPPPPPSYPPAGGVSSSSGGAL